MEIEQFWAALKAAGYTKHKIVKPKGGQSTVILQSRDHQVFPSVVDPADLSPDERRMTLDRFLRIHGS